MLIKNAIVNMPWDAEGFYETKADGFIAAVHIYECEGKEVPIMFKDGKAFMIYDEDLGAPASRSELQKALKEAVKEDGPTVDMEEWFPDDYIEISNGAEVDTDIADIYKLNGEQCKDIMDRLDDLSGYVDVSIEDM